MSDAEAHYREGLRHQDDGRHAEAEASYRRSLALDPRQPKAHNNLGCVLQMQGRLDDAVSSFRAALALDPQLAQANQNLAAITREAGAAHGALASYRRHLEANPGDAEAHNNLGNVYRELGMHREAIDSFAQAIQLAPDYAEAHFSRAFELLICGEYAEGFDEFEWRWKVRGLRNSLAGFPMQLWDGGALAGALLLHSEQGFGDTLHAIRYASLAAARVREVVVVCQRELIGLAAAVPGVSRALPAGAPLEGSFAAHLPLMSLPRVFRTTPQTIPWSGPYIQARKMERWQLPADSARLRVGLAWAGQPMQGDDRKRSLSLAALAPLAQSDVAFYSLQKGEAAAQATAPPAGMRVVELGSRFTDFSDTAGAMSHLDLVITVDTSVAHLAGAMGLPTWVLLSAVPDWRYGAEGERTPWYPTMRLFRQRADGDWGGVLVEVAQALREAVRRS